ncbi:MAG TPA: cysteine--tRNA ligase [Chloroflexia bacterium]|nr:cysteine--tRNA ligase [Chloroflexia bacterium]
MLKLYNTLSQEKEEFKSFDPAGKLARIYVCGVTPYDTSHMGHALVAVVFDVLHRYLEYKGYEVLHVQNLTDVDDDIIKRARREGVPFDQLGQSWDKIYRDGLAAINCLPFDRYIPASSAIDQIKEMVAKLVEGGHAYKASDGNVYFRAASFPTYGFMAHTNEQELLEKARAAAADSLADEPGNPAKESDLDFILWQAAKPDEPFWESPWGPGRPGWHIECSAISMDNLGPQFEVHGGGADLIFPHHSSEIAQTESVTGVAPLVRHWMHIAMLYLGGEKMSKSLGNLVLIRDALKEHSADAIRLYLLGAAHYRTPLHYEDEEVSKADKQVELLQRALQAQPASKGDAKDWSTRFFDAMDDDLDTPKAIEAMLSLAQAVLEGQVGAEGQAQLRTMAQILGLPLAG